MNKKNARMFFNNLRLNDLIYVKDILENETDYSDTPFTKEMIETMYREYPFLINEPIYFSKDIFFGGAYYWDKEKYLLKMPFILSNEGENFLKIVLFFLEKEGVSIEKAYNDRKKVLMNFIDKGEFHYAIDNNFLERDYFEYILRKIPKDKVYDYYFDHYTSADYGFSSFSKEDIGYIVSNKTLEAKEKTLKKIKKLPDEIVVYRGEGDMSVPFGYSYTTDINTAIFFAVRGTDTTARIIKGKIKKNDIIEYCDDRGEKEIIAFPDNIYDTEVIDLYNSDDMLGDGLSFMFTDLYYPYYELLREISLYNEESTDHSKAHLMRVLFLGIHILLNEYEDEMDNFTDEDFDNFLLALCMHDIGRDNEWDDTYHGRNSFERLVECEDLVYNHTRYADFIVDNPVLRFLMENHCIDDEQSYAELYNNSLIKDKEKTKLMYDILKDADALDRVRFGLRELDTNYLRCKNSLKYILFAMQAYEGLKYE